MIDCPPSPPISNKIRFSLELNKVNASCCQHGIYPIHLPLGSADVYAVYFQLHGHRFLVHEGVW